MFMAWLCLRKLGMNGNLRSTKYACNRSGKVRNRDSIESGKPVGEGVLRCHFHSTEKLPGLWQRTDGIHMENFLDLHGRTQVYILIYNANRRKPASFISSMAVNVSKNLRLSEYG